MGSLTIELPSQKSQTAFNLERWAQLVADPAMNRIEGRIETDRHGHVIMSPPPAAKHGYFQGEIVHLLKTLLSTGRVFSECPISTADGVRAADVAWASPDMVQKLGDNVCFPSAPEICVEVISPGNSEVEMDEKMSLYFDAGAQEVWFCSPSGEMSFYQPAGNEIAGSKLCPAFPKRLKS